MHLFDPSAAFQAGLALTVVAGMFVLFMRELYPTEVVRLLHNSGIPPMV